MQSSLVEFLTVCVLMCNANSYHSGIGVEACLVRKRIFGIDAQRHPAAALKEIVSGKKED